MPSTVWASWWISNFPATQAKFGDWFISISGCWHAHILLGMSWSRIEGHLSSVLGVPSTHWHLPLNHTWYFASTASGDCKASHHLACWDFQASSNQCPVLSDPSQSQGQAFLERHNETFSSLRPGTQKNVLHFTGTNSWFASSWWTGFITHS